MSCRQLTMYEWACDGCDATVRTELRVRPNHWADGPSVPVEPYSSKTLELCPACSRDPAAAAERWKAVQTKRPARTS